MDSVERISVIASALRIYIIGSMVWASPSLIPGFLYGFGDIASWVSNCTVGIAIVLFGIAAYKITKAI